MSKSEESVVIREGVRGANDCPAAVCPTFERTLTAQYFNRSRIISHWLCNDFRW